MSLPIAQRVLRDGTWSGTAERVTLDYEARFLRRKRLLTDTGRDFIVDLEKATSLDDGDALQLDDGSKVVVRAAEEPVLVVTGAALARFAWHIGNRHTPCEVEADRLIIQRDPVIRHMLGQIGAHVVEAILPFTPEGGAYGHGRTHSHDHGASAHSLDHEHAAKPGVLHPEDPSHAH